MTEAFMQEPTFWIEVKVPFDSALSKNRSHTHSAGGRRVYMRRSTRAARQLVTSMVRQQVRAQRAQPLEGRWHMRIHVQKPSARTDAHNLLDMLADAVQDGIGINDRWLVLEGIDWSIQRTRPMVTIDVWQYADEVREQSKPTRRKAAA